MQNIHKKKESPAGAVAAQDGSAPLAATSLRSSRLQIRGKDVSFSSIFSYNNK